MCLKGFTLLRMFKVLVGRSFSKSFSIECMLVSVLCLSL